MYTIMMQERREVNTDPQRRCYNGCHYKSEIIALPWVELEYEVAEHLEERLAFWRRLNDIAVKTRGPSAYTEFKAVEVTS